MALRVLQIVPGTSVDGPGLRTSVYLAGCSHGCPGCHNPASWDFRAGTAMTADQVAATVIAHGFNVTLTGGDPLQHADLAELTRLVELLRAEGLKIWCYTGYRYEELQDRPDLMPLLGMFEAIVEGPFIRELRTLDMPFRGSSNQRIMHPDGRIFMP